MCVAALPVLGALGGGSGGLFATSLGLNLASGLAQRSAAQSAARQQYQSSLKASESADKSLSRQAEAFGQRISEQRASSAQEKLAKTIQGLQARGALRASERAGLSLNLLARDQERQVLNQRESINQAIESANRQYSRNIEGLIAERDSRRNQLQSNINQAYNQVPSLGSVLLNTAVSGLNSYASLTGGLGKVGSTDDPFIGTVNDPYFRNVY
tara:strand:+ start:4276 stop:4914 length:639 start_codon:yes stop_codon:yes gene_type:complete